MNSQHGSILIVDDAPENLRLLAEILSGNQYNVRVARNGRAALATIHTVPPDIILLDIRMPNMNGYAVCEQIKADERTKDIPVIFLSALDEAVNKVKGFKVGGVDYITKPFQAEEVLARVETHLALREMQKRLEVQNTQLQKEISERKQIEDDLRESETRTNALLDTIPGLMFRLNREGTFLDYKAAISDLYVQAEETFIGKYCKDLLPAELARLTQKYIVKTLDSGTMQMFEYQLDIPNRGLCDYEARMSKSGEHEVTVIVRDISKSKQAERALRKAKEDAESANRAKSVFLANISHELRTPLTGILGYVQLLERDSTLTNSQHEGVDIIHRNGQHLLTLINDILDFTKIETNRFELHPSEFALPSLLMQIADMTRLNAGQEGLTFVYEAPAELPQIVHGDQKRLRQILVNLLGNAVKYTKQGKVIFRVTVCSEAQSLQSVVCSHPLRHSEDSVPHHKPIRFEVEDTGPGIPSEQLDGIFQPFQQADQYRIQEGSTGLGLAISQRLAALMHSRIQVRSKIGKGTSFWFDLDLPSNDTSIPRIPPELVSRTENTIITENMLSRALASLPLEWLATLKQGALEADFNLLTKVVAQIRAQDTELANVLAQLVRDFEYDEILLLLPQ